MNRVPIVLISGDDDVLISRSLNAHLEKALDGEDRRLALEELKIDYVREKRFATCRDKHELPFDFRLPKFTSLIEFQGMQHEISSERFGGIKALQSNQRRDKIKKDWANQNNLNLIYLNDYNQIEKQILKKYLKAFNY